jgi:hypothetical protein
MVALTPPPDRGLVAADLRSCTVSHGILSQTCRKDVVGACCVYPVSVRSKWRRERGGSDGREGEGVSERLG